MWLYRKIKEHPYLAMGMTLLLGGVAFPVLYLMAAAWTVYAITAVICLVAGPSLGGCLGWLVGREDRNQGSLSARRHSISSSRVVAPAHNNRELKQESKREEVPASPAARERFSPSGRKSTLLPGLLSGLDPSCETPVTKESDELGVSQMTLRRDASPASPVDARLSRALSPSIARSKEEEKQEAKDLPDVLKDIIIDYVGGDFGDSKAIFHPAYFAAHCSFFMTTTNGRKYNRAEAIFFLQYIVKGEEEKAKVMLQNNLALLFCTEVVTDYSGRRIKGTAYQIALGAEDIEMARMIQPYFRIAYDNDEEKARAEIKRQYDAQFTPESKEIEAKNAAADKEALNKVIQAIREATPDECRLLLENKESKAGELKGIAAELQQFRAYLDSKTEGVTTSGKHFNAHLLVEAFNQYDANYVAFGSWDAPKNNLFWRHVIGYIQRYLSTCYAQASCQGVFNIVNNDEQLIRSLQFRYSYDVSFFPLSLGVSGLGYEYAVAGGPPIDAARHAPPHDAAVGAAFYLNLYVQQKQRDGEFMQHPYEHGKRTQLSLIRPFFD